LLAEMKPLPLNETSALAASAPARYCRKAVAAAFVPNWTLKSPAASSTGLEPLTDGNGKNFASVPTTAGSLSPGIVVATKLASYTIADGAFALNTLSTE